MKSPVSFASDVLELLVAPASQTNRCTGWPVMVSNVSRVTVRISHRSAFDALFHRLGSNAGYVRTEYGCGLAADVSTTSFAFLTG